jgi:hypothetical protein
MPQCYAFLMEARCDPAAVNGKRKLDREVT